MCPWRILAGVADVTRILSAIGPGNPKAAAELLPLVYDERRKVAVARLADEKEGYTRDLLAEITRAAGLHRFDTRGPTGRRERG